MKSLSTGEAKRILKKHILTRSDVVDLLRIQKAAATAYITKARIAGKSDVEIVLFVEGEILGTNDVSAIVANKLQDGLVTDDVDVDEIRMLKCSVLSEIWSSC